MDISNAAIWRKFHIKHGDNLPFIGFARNNYTREDLASVFGELGFKIGAEIGVKHGDFAEVLIKACPGLKYIGVDPWIAYGRAVSQPRANRRYACTKERLKSYDTTLMRMSSMEAVKDIPDGSLDFVYIDGRHEFDFVMEDLIHWVPKVRHLGIVSGHDYYNFFEGGVVQAVNAYTQAHHITTWYITRDLLPSFFWVKL